jgi:hypothetical protein
MTTEAQLIDRAFTDRHDAALAQRERGEEFNERVAERANELLQGQFDPCRSDNIAEALCNWSDYSARRQDQLMKQLTAAMQQDRFEEAGRVLWELSQNYWNARAKEEVFWERRRRADGRDGD